MHCACRHTPRLVAPIGALQINDANLATWRKNKNNWMWDIAPKQKLLCGGLACLGLWTYEKYWKINMSSLFYCNRPVIQIRESGAKAQVIPISCAPNMFTQYPNPRTSPPGWSWSSIRTPCWPRSHGCQASALATSNQLQPGLRQRLRRQQGHVDGDGVFIFFICKPWDILAKPNSKHGVRLYIYILCMYNII